MPDSEIGLLADTGRELYVADAISDLTRLRLQLASASLAGISRRPEWGGIAASLRALGETHPAVVVDAFAQVLEVVGEEAYASQDHEFVALGIDTIDMLLRSGSGFDPQRLSHFVEQVRRFCDERGVVSPGIPEEQEAAPSGRPSSRSPFGLGNQPFELPPIDPPSWDLDEYAPKPAPVVAPPEDVAPPAPPDDSPEVPASPAPVAKKKRDTTPEAAEVPVSPAAPPKSRAKVRVKDRNKEALPEAPLVAAIEPLTQAPFAAAPQVDAVAELAATFDAVPAAGALAPEVAAASGAGVSKLVALAQGALWLAESLAPTGVAAAGAVSALDAIRRDALAALSCEHLVSAAGERRKVQVSDGSRNLLRRLQNEVGSFDEFVIEGEWCRIGLSEAAANVLERAIVLDAVPLFVRGDGGRHLWLPVQSQRLTVWETRADDGTHCVVPDLIAPVPVEGAPWRALVIGAGGVPTVVSVAAGVALPPGAPVVRLGSGAAVLDPMRWKRRRATCFVLGRVLGGLYWVAGAAMLAGEPAVILNSGTI